MPAQMGLTFFGSKKQFSNKILQIYLHPTSLALMCRYSVCCRVYVTYTKAFKPTPFKALSLVKRLHDTFNHLSNNVFINDGKC